MDVGANVSLIATTTTTNISGSSHGNEEQIEAVRDGDDSISCNRSGSSSNVDRPEGAGGRMNLNDPSMDLNQNCTAPMVAKSVGEAKDDVSGRKRGDSQEARRPSEEKLLRQLEEANRVLEADEKSLPVRAAFSSTPGHSRKGSGSSIVSSTSSNSFYSQQNSNENEDVDSHLTTEGSPTPGNTRRHSKKTFKPLLRTKSNRTMNKIEIAILSPVQQKLFLSDRRRHPAADQTDEIVFSSGSSSETLWEIWGRIINDWDSVKKKPAFLRELVRKGIPHEFRGMAWQLILGVHDSPWKQEYAEHMKKTSPCEKLIRRDIARTFPDHDFFKEKDGFGQESLFNVMKAYSLHDREVGYCQGSGFIVGLLLMQMPEEDAFAVLVRLMQDFRLRELFKPSMAELGLCMFKLECLIQELLPTLLVHFQTQNFDTSMYASSWFLTLYVTSLPLSLARRIMDLFVSEGMEMIFRVGVAILQSCQEDLLALDMEGLLKYLQKDLRGRFELEADQDNLLHTAYNIKYSHKKMKKLEKEYTALKTKENEDQIELRRLRTENRLLRQRIDNLEKVEAKLLRQNEESATLADKLVQDQVTWAQEVEQCYALRNELSVTRQQLKETQKKLFDAEDIIGDIRKRTRIIEDAVHLDESEERNMVKHLQEELIAVRLREAETAGTIKELKLKISELEDTNLRLQRAPSNDVQQLQEELIAVKLREAEANLSLKELRMKVNEIESYWEAHMDRVRQNSPREKNSKAELRHLQEEVMALKLKEARAVSDVKDAKQKLMELETQNQICTNQIRRMGEENKELKHQLEEAAEREKDLRMNIKDLTRKLDDTESKRKEEAMMSRIKDAENIQQLAELRHRIVEIDIQKEELLAAGQLYDKGENQELENKLHDLQDEVLQLHLSLNKPNLPRSSIMTDSYLGNNSDEELESEIRDSENLDQTLSDIIEGKSHSSSSRTSLRDNEEGTSGYGYSLFLYKQGSSSGGGDSSLLEARTASKSDPPHDESGTDRLSSQAQDERSGCAAGEGCVKGIVGKRVTTSRSHQGTLPTVAATSSPFTGVKDSSDLPTPHSGESTVIADCDTPSRDHNDSGFKGKSPSFSEAPVFAHTNQVPGLKAGVVHSKDGSDGVRPGYKTQISDPDPHFPVDWELYEEVVEMSPKMEVRVLSHNSSDRESRKGSSFRNSLERSCSVGSSSSLNSSRKSSVDRGLSPAPSPPTTCTPAVLIQAKRGSSQTNGSHDGKAGSRVKGQQEYLRRESLPQADIHDRRKEIPDVVVIYEPSCAAGSLLCSCEDQDDADFMLKESTV